MTCGIYKLESPSGNFYIGSSKRTERRIRGHLTELQKGIHCNEALTRARAKYGDLKGSIVLVCREEDLLFYEQLCIDGLRPIYNLSKIAGKVEFTSAVRSKISEYAKGRSPTMATREKIAQKLRVTTHNHGNGMNAETLARMAATLRGRPSPNKGRKASEATKHLLSKIMMGQKRRLGKRHTEATKLKISQSKKANPVRYWLGRPRSEATKLKISNTLKMRGAAR